MVSGEKDDVLAVARAFVALVDDEMWILGESGRGENQGSGQGENDQDELGHGSIPAREVTKATENSKNPVFSENSYLRT